MFSVAECLSSLIYNNQLELKIIAKIKPTSRLSTQGRVIEIEQEGWAQPFKRFLSRESRNDTIECLEKIVTQAVEITNVIMSNLRLSKNESDLKSLIQLQDYSITLKHACEGLTNLTIRYKEDEKVTAQIESIIQKINNQLRVVERIIPLGDPKHEELF